jgi:hypothetical protein
MKRMNQLLSGQDLLIQPFLASVKTKGEVSLIFIENEFVHAIKKKPTQGDFKVQGTHHVVSCCIVFRACAIVCCMRAPSNPRLGASVRRRQDRAT